MARQLPPNLQGLREGGVSFANHYTASNDCTPARAALLTGLYTHQTGCLITGGSTLDAAFPTWGRLLGDQGYSTSWYGKWHLTHGDHHWNDESGPPALARYGFAGGTFPSPDGAPGQGWRVDPRIAEEFEEWFASLEGSEPWCTTVSFVNPHDIAWWYRFSDRVASEAQAPIVANALPPNFETPEMLMAGAQAAAAALVAGNGGKILRHGAVHRPGSAERLAAVPGSLPEAPARG